MRAVKRSTHRCGRGHQFDARPSGSSPPPVRACSSRTASSRTPASAGVNWRTSSAVGESRTPTIVRSPEPESESPLNHRRELAPWRGQLPHGVTERHAPPRPSGGKVGEGECRKRCLAWGGFRGGGRSSRWCDRTVSVDPRSLRLPSRVPVFTGSSPFWVLPQPWGLARRLPVARTTFTKTPSKGAKGQRALRLGGSRCG